MFRDQPISALSSPPPPAPAAQLSLPPQPNAEGSQQHALGGAHPTVQLTVSSLAVSLQPISPVLTAKTVVSYGQVRVSRPRITPHYDGARLRHGWERAKLFSRNSLRVVAPGASFRRSLPPPPRQSPPRPAPAPAGERSRAPAAAPGAWSERRLKMQVRPPARRRAGVGAARAGRAGAEGRVRRRLACGAASGTGCSTRSTPCTSRGGRGP